MTVDMYFTCIMYIKLIFFVIIITKYFIHCEQTFPLIQIRNETTRSQRIHFSTFKRVFVNSNEWIPEEQCSFNPRLVKKLINKETNMISILSNFEVYYNSTFFLDKLLCKH